MSPESSARSGTGRRDVLLVAVLAAVLFLPPVGYRSIVTSHEARFALIARDMMTRGVWFDAVVRGEPYRNKPPLHPWSIVAASAWTGRVTEASARLPSALATLATAVGTCLLAGRLFGGRAGLLAGLVTVTSYGVFAHSQMILPDMLMIAFGMLAGYWFWRAVTEPGEPLALVAFWALLGLGVFVKGPAGLLPLAVAVAWLATAHGVAGLRRLWSWPGVLLFVALSLVWVIPFMILGQTERFVGNVLWSDWVRFYLRAPRPGAIGGQLVDLVIGFAPWTLLAPLALVHAYRTRATPAVRFAILWLVVQFVLIMASTNQRVRYLLSIYPGLTLLVAWWAVDAARPRRATIVKWTAAAMAVALLTSIWVYDRWINATRDFKTVAAAVERHARGREVGVFVSKGEYLQIDYYLGRDLVTLWVPDQLVAYLARPERPLVVLNQESWERHQKQMPPDVDVLEAPFVGGETMRLVRGR